ncbi:hypothetical protein Tco_0156946 [Tanacetum coccineum]
MANLSEDIQCAENGVNILKSIDKGPFQMGTFWETLVEGNEGALHLGPRLYFDLSPEDKDRMQLNSKFVNNMLPEWGRFITTVKLNRGAAGYGGAQNIVVNANPGQARQIKCCNYNAQENRVALDEKQLLFIAGGQDNAVDEDVDEQPTMFMANLLSADPVYDEASLSYDSDILSEVPDHDFFMGLLFVNIMKSRDV